MNAKKKNLALAGIAVLLVAVLAVAAVLYQKFSGEYAGENLGSTEEAQLAAPDFTVLDSEGNEVQLSDYVGKPIVPTSGPSGAITARRKCRILTRPMRPTQRCSSSW